MVSLEQALASKISHDELKTWLDDYAIPWRELMAHYNCAIMEVETKFKVLNEKFALGNDCNPIASIKSRLKSPKSIIDKMIRNKFPLTVDSIEKNLHDIAGVRVVCSYLSDIYMLANALLSQDDVFLIERKDYIADPKPNGYRSLHLIISTPIFLLGQKKMMKVEVQLRTLAMDTWASQEHQIRYKKNNGAITPEMSRELHDCAELCARLDETMENIRKRCGMES